MAEGMSLEEALRWARCLSEPERALELDRTDTEFLAEATARLLVEFDRVTNNAFKPPPGEDPWTWTPTQT